MSKYKSMQTSYSHQKSIPIRRLDTNTLIITHCDADMLTEEHKTYNTDYIRYHLHYSDSKCPDRLIMFVNDGKIIE